MCSRLSRNADCSVLGWNPNPDVDVMASDLRFRFVYVCIRRYTVLLPSHPLVKIILTEGQKLSSGRINHALGSLPLRANLPQYLVRIQAQLASGPFRPILPFHFRNVARFSSAHFRIAVASDPALFHPPPWFHASLRSLGSSMP